MRYVLSAALLTISAASHAATAETWVCHVASRKIKPFCITQKGAVCEVVGESTESGSLDGSGYRLYGDSAAVASEPGGNVADLVNTPTWDISCSRDKMSGQRSCAVSRGALWVFFRGSSITVSVGDEHFPGSASSIKVGSRRFDSSHRDGNFTASQQIVDLLKDGQPVVTRYMKWPNRYWVDDEFTVSGFQASAMLARWLLKNGTLN